MTNIHPYPDVVHAVCDLRLLIDTASLNPLLYGTTCMHGTLAQVLAQKALTERRTIRSVRLAAAVTVHRFST